MKKSDYLKSLFSEKGMTMKSIALNLGMSQPLFSQKVNGIRVFKNEEIAKLLKLLDMSYEEVFLAKKTKTIHDNNEFIVVVDGQEYVFDNSLKNKITKYIKKMERSTL